MCNDEKDTELILPTTTPLPPQQFDPANYTMILASLILIGTCVLLCLTVSIIVYIVNRKRVVTRRQSTDLEAYRNSLYGLIDESSGSGSGAPLLVQRTIARQIQKIRTVGRGRYGEVWLAKWRDESVAVKQFFTTEESSWMRETEIYQLVSMRHENILGYIAADISGVGDLTSMLIITQYHEHGSLHDYLQKHELTPQMLHCLVASLMSGLAHLHLEMIGNPNKPAIAHRDVKSRNILVKRNGECAIADFGLALKNAPGDLPVTGNIRVGTRRYMAPEVLDQSVNRADLDAFKAADIYSVSLVFWEMARRCVTISSETKQPICDPYMQPYDGVVSSDPSFDDMHGVVCLQHIRPSIEKRWRDEEILHVMSKIMVECWHPKAKARLTAMRIKKTINKVLVNDDDSNENETAFVKKAAMAGRSD